MSKKRRRLPARGAGGKFKKKTHHRRASSGGRRRRKNPMTVLVANPRRKPRRRRAASRPALVARRRAPARRKNPRKHKFTYRMHGRRHHRRRNPGVGRMKIGYYVRIGVFGAAGVMVARATGYYYSEYVAKHVIGTETDANGWRHIANEVLRILAMEIATIGIGMAMQKARMRGEHVTAFIVGGTAETAREVLGIALNKLSPSTDRRQFGLDGPRGDLPAAYRDEETGEVMVRLSDGNYYPHGQLGDLIDREELEGLGDLIDRADLAGPGYLRAGGG